MSGRRQSDLSASAERDLRILGQLLGDEGGRPGLDSQHVLVEPTTGLPTLQLMLLRIETELASRSQVGLLTLHVSPAVRLEQLFGWETFDDISRNVADLLREVKQECLREQDFLAEISVSGTSFVLVLSAPRSGRPLDYATLGAMRERVRGELVARIAARYPEEVAQQFDCSIGCVVIAADGSVPLQRLILRGLDAAYADAYGERDRKLQERRAALEVVIAHRQVTAVFQPILDLEQERVLGWEALARGPAGEMENPAFLFDLASRTGMVWQLERLCRDAAATQLPSLPPGQHLFLNIDAESMFDPSLSLRASKENFGGRVVLELTERAAITDFRLFQRVLEMVRQLGMRFAIDDLGSAYSGLRLVAESRPDFIKVDMGVTRGLQLDDVRAELVRMLLHLSQRIGSTLIVEGVETAEDLAVLRGLGVRYVQGFLFGPPQGDLAPFDVRAALAAIAAP